MPSRPNDMSDDFDNWLAEREKEAPSDDGGILRPGQRIGAYRIVRQLGVGGMGQVYEAEHVALGVRRALKVFSTESEHSEFLRKRFVAEGRILADLQHPRIVRVYDLVVDEDSGMAYFEMDLVLSPDGQPRTLADELQDGVDEEKIVGWFKDICEGLAYIHSQSVVHRDISLDNILIGRDGRAVITDFGIAKIIDDSYRKKIDVTVTMVYKDGSEVRIGKERYMAPELKKPNGKASSATDAWALGVLLFRMLSGSWYDVGTRLEDWHADLKYDWHPVLSQLFNPEPKMRLGSGGIAALPTLLSRKTHSVALWRRKWIIACSVAALLFVVVVWSLHFIKRIDMSQTTAVQHGDVTENGLIYDIVADKVSGERATIVNAQNINGDIVIPSYINGRSVTTIGDRAFLGCSNVTSVVIPETVRSIRDEAFLGCAALTNVTIPASVTSIGENAFTWCEGMSNFVVATGNRRYKSDAGLLLTKDGRTLISGVNGCEMIPKEVTHIAEWAFSGRRQLTNIMIPGSVMQIGDCAFTDCDRLTNVIIRAGVTSIGALAFGGCSNLLYVTIPSSVTSIGEWAFPKCDKGRTFFVSPGDVDRVRTMYADSASLFKGGPFIDDGAKFVEVEMDVFNGESSRHKIVATGKCLENEKEFKYEFITDKETGTKSVAIVKLLEPVMGNCAIPASIDGYSVTCIKDNAFRFCFATNVTIPASVTNISDSALAFSFLKTFRVAEDNPAYKSISGDLLTKDGKTLILCGVNRNVVIPDGVVSVREDALRGGGGHTSVTIPASWTNIWASAFVRCTGLSKIVVSADNPVYKSVSGLLLTKDGKTLVVGVEGDVKIPDGVRHVGNGAFNGRHRLSSVEMPASITSIGKKAFYDCWLLTSVTIPDGVTCIEEGSFSYCKMLVHVKMPDSVTHIGSQAFRNCDWLASVEIPASVKSIGDSAFSGCDILKSVAFAGNVKSIGVGAFSCELLKTVYVAPGGADRIKKLFVDSGHDISNIEFVEREADEK